MKKALKFTLTQVEESIAPTIVTTWVDANFILKRWGNRAPPNSGHYKIDFEIVFEDEAVYRGHYYLFHRDIEPWPDLAAHVIRVLRFSAGTWKPSWMTEEQYKTMQSLNTIEQVNALGWLKKYIIGD